MPSAGCGRPTIWRRLRPVNNPSAPLMTGARPSRAATLAVVDPRLVPGMAIVLGIDKFMRECRALTTIIGDGIATVVVAWRRPRPG